MNSIKKPIEVQQELEKQPSILTRTKIKLWLEFCKCEVYMKLIQGSTIYSFDGVAL